MALGLLKLILFVGKVGGSSPKKKKNLEVRGGQVMNSEAYLDYKFRSTIIVWPPIEIMVTDIT